MREKARNGKSCSSNGSMKTPSIRFWKMRSGLRLDTLDSSSVQLRAVGQSNCLRNHRADGLFFDGL